ncbi:MULTISPECIES: OBAP family protein [unclassified Chelatococcus]|uniref:OBAP family protein n=1 Tax=unclassified Chelatococcus TaxID=2638111 RepID=UPI001BCDCD8A|nr:MULTISPECIES: OBAP family protein [unclassified Chelatococcus]MBS7700423.1 OBAP family protein [Chelatococcus sp. YT9]MBX3556219.1 OBAP family protein [Chelatococcus sp.]
MGWTDASLSRRGVGQLIGGAATLLACACGRAAAQDTGVHRDQPVTGADKSTKSTMLGMGADLLQSKGPINDINMYLNGFHFYADDMGRQIEAHHYCTHVTEDFYQCVIYDDNKEGARLIGIEYIVSERVFKTLPDDEKQLWHSHRHETTSGELVMPRIPGPVEHTAIATLVNTYGKTWHTWQIDLDNKLPTGIPQLMMGFTADNQLRSEMREDRDRRLGIETEEKKKAREDLLRSAPQVVTGADSWTDGQAPQLVLSQLPLKNRRS